MWETEGDRKGEKKIEREMNKGRKRKGNFATEYLAGKFEVPHHPANSR